jgi:hypothetical protein
VQSFCLTRIVIVLQRADILAAVYHIDKWKYRDCIPLGKILLVRYPIKCKGDRTMEAMPTRDEMTIDERRKLVKLMVPHYQQAMRKERSQLLSKMD